MKFGKLEKVDGIRFDMPQDPEATTALLSSLAPRQGAVQVYFGCTGWSMKEWVGTFYPKGTKSQDYLLAYAKQFNTIELNTTHYRIPDAALIQKWVEQTPAHFRFSPKLPQVISHSNDLGLSGRYTQLFCEEIVGLGERLGVSFMQLPPQFGPKQLPILEQFLERFPLREVPLAVEFRDETLLDNNSNASKTVNEMLRHYGVGTVMSDVAGRRDALHLQLTTATAMVRFVGNDLHASDYERIDAWCEKLKLWFDAGLHSVYFFHHQPENLLAPDMAVYFAKKMNEVCGLSLSIPQKYDDAQLSLF